MARFVGEVRFFCREQSGAEFLIPYWFKTAPKLDELNVGFQRFNYYLPWDGRKVARLELSEGRCQWWPSSKQQSYDSERAGVHDFKLIYSRMRYALDDVIVVYMILPLLCV